MEWSNAHQTQPWHVVSRKINWGGPKKKEYHNCNIIIVITLFLHSSAYDTTVFLSTFKWNEPPPVFHPLFRGTEVFIVWKEFSRDRNNPCTKHHKIYHTYYRTLFFYLQVEKKMQVSRKKMLEAGIISKSLGFWWFPAEKEIFSLLFQVLGETLLFWVKEF